MKHLTDDELMELVIKGQTEQLAELYQRYKQELFGFYYQITKQPALCEDLIQNVFVRVIKYAGTYRSKGLFRSWLYQLARNAYADLARNNQQKFQSGFESLQDRDVQEKKDNDTDDGQSELLALALQNLDEEKRELVILHRYQSMTYAEIAELMQSNEGAIKVRMFRIIKELREQFNRLQKDQA